MAPKDGGELRHMLFTALTMGKPVAIRYPKGFCFNVGQGPLTMLDLGKSEVVREGKKLTLVTIGSVFSEALKAAEILKAEGIETTLINARFVKPLDPRIADYINRTGKAVVVEENSVTGGFGSAVLELCQQNKVRADLELIGLPDRFVEHGSQDELRRLCGLHYENIVRVAKKMLENGANVSVKKKTRVNA
jgi:1-deoxy-D-xylulose-5-phosphate synthase